MWTSRRARISRRLDIRRSAEASPVACSGQTFHGSLREFGHGRCPRQAVVVRRLFSASDCTRGGIPAGATRLAEGERGMGRSPSECTA